MSDYMSPLGARFGDKIIDGVKRDLRGIFEKVRKDALSDGYPPGTVPMQAQKRSPLISPFE